MSVDPRRTLREARLAAKLTQEEAALAAGYKSKSGWANVELGTNTPAADMMVKMAGVVGKPPAEVFEELRPSAAAVVEEGDHG